MINKKYVDKLPRWVGGWAGAALRWERVTVVGLLVMSPGLRGVAQRVGTGVEAYFQGNCVYRVTVKSKVEDLSDKDIHKVLTVGDLLTVTMKDGNYKLSTEYADTYVIKNDRKEYIKFRKIDTVFYLDFDSDTDRVTGIVRNNAVVAVGGYPCKGVTIE